MQAIHPTRSRASLVARQESMTQPDRPRHAGAGQSLPSRLCCTPRPGLSLLLGNESACEASVGQSVVEDGLRIVLVLEGSIDVSYGGRRLQLAAGRGAAGWLDAAMVTMLEPEPCRRVVAPGETAQRVSIGLRRPWLEQSLGDLPGAFALSTARHLDIRSWQACAQARVLAAQLIHPPPLPEHLRGMYLESRAIELVIDALTQAAPAPIPARPAPALRPAVHRRMLELKAWLGENASAPLSIAQIARQMNTTSTTLQRHFRLAHGMPLFEYLQQERLRQARRALEREGISVGEAAALAGYANQSSFATAFKRLFGLSPRQVRPRL